MNSRKQTLEEILGRSINGNESTIAVANEVREKLQTILKREINPSERVSDVLKEYEVKKTNYTLFMNGKLYGSGSRDYMTELFRDYVEFCDMYGKEQVSFKVVRGLSKGGD